MFQGFVIMICSILLIKQAFLRLETTVFTCLIFTQYAMTLTEVLNIQIFIVRIFTHLYDSVKFIVSIDLPYDFIIIS